MNSKSLARGSLWILLAAAIAAPLPASAQLRRPGIVTIEREDRSKSELVKEEGAIYLEGMVEKELAVRVTASAAVYANLQGERWMGNLLPDQNAVLLAVSEKAYRVRARAKQGQVAGWVSKAAIAGIPEGFEDNLRQYHERYLIVSELIENKQVALGMTVADWWRVTGREPNAMFMGGVDRDGFYRLLTERLGRL